MPKYKTCTSCREKKSSEDFYTSFTRCKACAIAYSKARNKAVNATMVTKMDEILAQQEQILLMQKRLEKKLTARVDAIECTMEKMTKRMKKLAL